MKNIMVTGSKGFVGNHVYTRLLREQELNIFEFDLPEFNFINPIIVNEFITKNEIDTIIHIGAIAGLKYCMERPDNAIKANVLGTSVLLAAAKKHKCNFIHTSTWAVKGKLEHPYDISKKMAEDLVLMYNKVYNVPAMCLRLATMYGTGMRKNGVIWAFLDKSLKGEDITIQGDGQQFRQFLWVEDAAEAYVEALRNFDSGTCHEIQAAEPTTIKQLAFSVYPDSQDKVKFVEARKGDETSFIVPPTKTLGNWKAKVGISEGMAKLKEFIKDEV